MEDVTEWLEKVGLMQGGVARYCRTSQQLADELRNGLILAGLAAKLDPKNVGKASIVGRPSTDIQRRSNVKAFVDAYNRSFKLRSARFRADDVEMRDNTEEVVDAMHDVARELEDKLKIRAFKMPKSSAFPRRASSSSDDDENSGKSIYEHYSLSNENSWTFAGSGEMGDEDPNHKALEAFYTCFDVEEEHGDDEDDDEARCDIMSHYQLSVKELFDKNQQFCNALQLYELVGQHATDSDIQRMFLFDDFNYIIRKLRKFHQKLQADLETAGINGAWYGVLVSNKTNFLQYCNVVLVAQNVTELILSKPQEILDEQLKIVRQKSGVDGDGGVVSFNALLSYPFVHLLAHKTRLERALKEIQRDHYTDGELRGIESAIEAMDDVSLFVNSYMSDTEYIKNTEKIFEKMTGMERVQQGLHHDFMFRGGHMVMSAKMKLRLISEPNKFRSCQLIVFEEFLIVFDIVDRRDSGELFDFKQLVQLRHIVGVEKEHFKSCEVLHVKGGEGMMEAKASMSFMIKGKRAELDELEEKIKDHMRPFLSKCCLRKGKVIRQKDPKSSEVPQGITCNLCKHLLRGRINLGLTCQGCGQDYHKECFDHRQAISARDSLQSTKSNDVNPAEMLEGGFSKEKEITLGDRVDLARMMTSSAPEGTYLIRPAADSKASSNLTLCVLDKKETGDRTRDLTYKKYRVRVEKSGSKTVYAITLSPGTEEVFDTLGGLVEKNRRLLNLGDNFLEWEERQSWNPGAMSNTSEADTSKEEWRVRVGTKEDERLMRSTSPESGTFLVRKSDEGRLALCVMLVTDGGEHVVQKHHILVDREGNVDAYRLVDKTPNGVVNEELFENLDDLVWNKRHQLQLRHNFLKAESPLREEVTQSPGDESLLQKRNGQPLPDVINVHEGTEEQPQCRVTLAASPQIARKSTPQPPSSRILPAAALKDKPAGSYLVSRRSRDCACAVHVIQDDRRVASVKFDSVADGFVRRGSASKTVYGAVQDYIAKHGELFRHPVEEEADSPHSDP